MVSELLLQAFCCSLEEEAEERGEGEDGTGSE